MPFDKEAILGLLEQAFPGGLRVVEIAAAFGVRKRDEHRLRKLLASLERDGRVAKVGRGVYARVAESGRDQRLIGRISVHPAGYGFVVSEDGSDDVFVPAKYRGSALDGDRVALATWQGHKGTEGRVEEILARGRAKLTGVVRSAGRSVYLEPDDPRIASDYGSVALDEGSGGARPGQAVVVEISHYPTDESPEIGARVLRVLGDPDDPRTEIDKIVTCADLPDRFPPHAVAQAERTPTTVGPDDLADRIDLRDREFVTIDPETARDFDDALCVEDGPGGGLRVWVAIADVSHYVAAGDALDQEAAIRGVSVYLPDQVIPMLPLELSAGICSLNPEEDRCAMVVRLDFDDRGHPVGQTFAAAVIRSRARLDYPGVAAALSGDLRGRRAHYRRWRPALLQMDALAAKLRTRRSRRGSLEMELPEAKVLLDRDDPLLVRDVVRAKGAANEKRAYHLVEEFMIAANEAVGDFFRSRGLPTVWRIHAAPKRDRVETLAEVLSSYGIAVDVDEAVTPQGMQKVLEALAEHEASRALTFLLLRTLKQAVYSTENVGHFGLASEAYLHFTSPIRRYPDLLVHRLLKYYLHGEGQASGGAVSSNPLSEEELQAEASDASANERRALEVEREAVSMYRAYLMREQVGEQIPGTVFGVTNFGAFVEIDKPFVEGLVRLESLGDDHFELDPSSMRLIGRKSGMTISLGDRVLVEVVEASVTLRRVDFRLVEPTPTRKQKGARSASRTKGRSASRTKGRSPSRTKGRKKKR